jgi:hypothetical protein
MVVTELEPAIAPIEARAPRRVLVTAPLARAAIGLVYGAALRGWMRLISTDPDFSWSGTIFIVGAFAIGFAATGFVVGSRRRGHRALLVLARVAAVILSLACFGGAGVVMLPTIVLGALAFARTDWPRPARRTAGAFAALTVFPVLIGLDDLALLRAIPGAVLYVALVLFEIRILAEPYRPSIARLGRAAKVLTALFGGLGVLSAVMMTVGVAASGG